MPYEFSENIQRGILYLCKSNKDFYLQIVNLIKESYFEYPSHQNIFNTIKNYFDSYLKLPNDDFVLEEIRDKLGETESITEYEDELEFINKVDITAINNQEYYMDLIEKFARRSAIKEAIKESLTLIQEDNIDAVPEVIKKALLINRDINVGQSYFDVARNRWDRILGTEEAEKFGTVLPMCNDQLEGGNSRKELCMVIAPPGVGKSLWLVNQSVQALTEQRKVLYLSLEMSEDKISQRFDSVMTGLPNRKLKEVSTQLRLHQKLEAAKEKYPNSRLIIKEFPTGQATVATVRALLHQLENYEGFVPDILIVDYLELLRPCRKIEAEWQAQQRIAEELRGLAVEYNMLVWTATQTNRQGKMVKIITDAELGDSYGKIRTADWAISLNQTEEEYSQGKMRGYIVKARDSRQRYIIPMSVNYKNLRITQELDYDETEKAISA